MSDYAFYAAMLRFVEGKIRHSGAAQADPRTGMMMDLLAGAAESVAAGRTMHFAADRLDLAARAFAGFAAFLQKQILPEAVAHGNAEGEQERVQQCVNTA